MPYIYQVSFDQPRQQKRPLAYAGADLGRVVDYLNSLLPDFPGFLSSRAMYSLHLADATRVVYQSVWEEWADVEEHRRSALEESKVFSYWGMVKPEDIRIGIFAEVGSA